MEPHIKKVIQFVISSSNQGQTFARPHYWATSEIESDRYTSRDYSDARAHYIFKYTISGRGIVKSETKNWTAGPGSIILIKLPSDQYEFIKDPDCPDPWKGMYFEFQAGALAPMVDELIANSIIYAQNKDVDIGKKMFEYDQAWYPNEKIWFRGNFINISPIEGNSLILYLLSALKPLESQTLNINTKLINSVCSYIRLNLTRPLDVDHLARRFAISRGHLTRLFQQHLNISPNQFIRRERVCQICSLIINTNYSNDEIAEQVGIHSAVHYHRMFKQLIGMTPHEFKNSTMKLEILKQL